MSFRALLIVAIVPVLLQPIARAAEADAKPAGNRPERVAWFQELAFGMFIHWNGDSPLGVVISHSMAAADRDYLDRYVAEVPKMFNPERFEPRRWAKLAKLAGMRYVVFTTKHHSGFCMFETKTTDFNVMNTPFKRDITREVVEAFRAEGIAIGFYYSPDDFWVLYKQGHEITRRRPEAQPVNNPGLMAHDKAQLRELLTNYGPIDVMFLDGPAEGLRELCWEVQPNIVVTRGAMETPEQEMPDKPLKGPWEACFTMGNEWNYKPTNEEYKSGTELIRMLIETKARGGNLLLNVGPHPDGYIPKEQEERLREVALWNFVNGECIFGTEPWSVAKEGDIWFTRRGDTVYAICAGKPWPWQEWQTITLRSVRATAETKVSIVGLSGKVAEYDPNLVPMPSYKQDADGLHIRAMRAHRMYTDYKWPNPVVIRITKAAAPEPAP